MESLGIISYLVFIIVLNVLFLFAYLKVSRYFHWFDLPNEDRKVHSVAKPTSAGLVFMIPILIALLLTPAHLFIHDYTVGFSLLLLLIVGGIDDFKPISAQFRLIVLLLVSGYLLVQFFPNNHLYSFTMTIYLLGIIWWVNLYNFMDGADGMAVLHSLCAVVGYGILFYFSTNQSAQMFLPYLIIFGLCLLAFLLFNFPVAKMFMGDSGSLSVAFLLATIALYGLSLNLYDEVLIVSFHLVFIVDATLTLFARLKFKQKLTQAHNLHYYQALIHSGKSHWLISSIYFLISLFTVGVAVLLDYLETNLVIRLSVLILETLVLSCFWFNYHNKTKFKRFI